MTVVLPSNYEITDDGKVRKKKRSKFGNVKEEIDGVTFDSGMEGFRYLELKQLQDCELIQDLDIHPKFELQPGFETPSGEKFRAVTYEADFSYICDGRLIVEDVKGYETDVFKLKEKLFRYKYPDVEFIVLFKNGERR